MNGHIKVLFDLLKNRKHDIGCEVGVHTGETTKYLLENLPGIKKYFAIDPWKIYEMYDGKLYRKPGNKIFKTMYEAKKRFYKVVKPYKGKVVVYEMTSVAASKHILKDSLDWVFIDANHEYEYIKENLMLWSDRVKLGGLISGHDYGGKKWSGIKKAVDEFVPADKLTIYSCNVWSCIKGEF